jgi:hypothetical protein
MTNQPRRIFPGLIGPAKTLYGATLLSPSADCGCALEGDASAPARLLLPPRLIIPASATVKRSLWVFRTPKLELLKD